MGPADRRAPRRLARARGQNLPAAMRRSELLVPQHAPADAGADDPLSRAGFTHRLADGLYTLLPLGQRVARRIGAIVHQELARAGALEVSMPLLQPAALWERSIGGGESRAAAFGSQLFRVAAAGLVLAPTHEEVAALLAAACIDSRSALPRTVYQVLHRFRDQDGDPSAGLLRTREFIMADAYGFHADESGLDRGYEALKEALAAVVARCGAQARFVAADPGAMGGHASEELIAELPRGAGTVALRCGACDWAAGVDVAAAPASRRFDEEPRPLEEVGVGAGPGEDPCARLGLEPARRLRAVPFVTGGRVAVAVVAGDRSVNPAKLSRALSHVDGGAAGLHPASAAELAAMGASYDWISLVHTPARVLVALDERLRGQANFAVPSRRRGRFLVNVCPGRDFRVDLHADVSAAEEGDRCPRCDGTLRALRGVEVAHAFKLGTRFPEAFGAALVVAGRPSPLWMGCYGLGVTRLVATIAEQWRDERGLVWPERVAPFLAAVVPARGGDAAPAAACQGTLRDAGVDVLLEDLHRPVEEALSELERFGIPLVLVVRGDEAELRERASGRRERLPLAAAAMRVRERGTARA